MLLRSLTHGLCDVHMFDGRFAKFALSAMKNKCDTISHIARSLVSINCTVFSQNVEKLCQHLEIHKDELISRTSNEVLRILTHKCEMKCKTEESRSRASVLNELSLMRDNVYECELSKDDINYMIIDICLN
jgi:hypothetical protein